MSIERLLPAKGTGAIDAMEDYWYAVAYAIESSMREAGATAGEDYTINQLYTLAQPFVLERFKNKDKTMDFTTPFDDFI